MLAEREQIIKAAEPKAAEGNMLNGDEPDMLSRKMRRALRLHPELYK